MRMWLATFVALSMLPLSAGDAWAIDGLVPTITSATDITTRRTTLITQIWGTSTLPATLATVTQGIINPFPSYNVARVDQYVASMSNGQSNTSNFYLANSPNNNRVVIFNGGHTGGPSCNWTSAFTPYENITTTLQALLAAGYSVFAMNMPACGSASQHIALFTNYGNAAMGYFLEPAIQAMNYWDAHYTFRDYNITGLSGGGWTATLLPALDTRIKTSIPVAGSWPGMIFNATFGCNISYAICGDNCTTGACAELNWTNFYSVAGYVDLYVMNGYGPNRRQFQILNYADDCCFGNAQFVGVGANTTYGVTYPMFVQHYTVAVKQLETVVQPVHFDGMIDYTSVHHQISSNALSAILSILASTGPGNAGGGRRLFHMW